MKKKLTHVDKKGEVHMVDISAKKESSRYAVAGARVSMSRELLDQLRENRLAKGDALSAARLAGIQAAKRTAELIPLCHQLQLTHVSVDIELVEDPPRVEIEAVVKTHYKTGAEMEALTAAAVTALTIYDMGKAVDKSMIIDSIRLLKKGGGRSGKWERGNSPSS
jgi:cyclic pyranopterin phosphate synthase